MIFYSQPSKGSEAGKIKYKEINRKLWMLTDKT